jgi:hypothetical protein
MRDNVLAKQREGWPEATAALPGAQRGRVAQAASEPEPTARVAVALHRARLGIERPGGYFKLKMLLVRTLRRGFKTSILEVDDAEAPAGSEAELFEVTVEPGDPQDYARAVRTVRRVLRSRPWLE